MSDDGISSLIAELEAKILQLAKAIERNDRALDKLSPWSLFKSLVLGMLTGLTGIGLVIAAAMLWQRW